MSTRVPKSVARRNQRKDFARKNPKRLLTVDDSYLMGKIFTDKGWVSFPGHEPILGKHLEVIGKLSPDQKKLYLDLTGRFLWKFDYTVDIVTQINRILTQFKNYDNYFAVRCVKIEGEGSSKSPDVVIYELKNPLVTAQLVKPLEFIDRMSQLKNLKADVGKSLFILVDDFVGTGKTALDSVDDILARNPAVKGRIVVMCVVAMSQGIEALKAEGIPVFASHIMRRGISDHYSGDALGRNVGLMTEMESLLNINSCNFGYGRSEALVCLKRCPNNTFPIYWHGNRSPYPRHRI